MRRPTTCLGPAELKDLLYGGLSEMEEGRMAEHLDGCPACRTALDRAALEADGGPTWHLPRAAGAPLDEALRRAVHALKGDTQSLRAAPDSLCSRLAPRVEAEDRLAERVDHVGSWPERLGHYEVTGVIGRGGFGVVLKAFDAALSRFVAIKVLAPHLSSSAAARRRFAREARAAAAVSHEHVVAIHGVDEADGQPYLVMEYVAGISLQERLDRGGALGLKEVLRIGMQVASGLAAAHAQGLIHRDVKPANILLESGIERVKLTDFGLARAVDDASLTASGVLAGTPMYMAPEQARGQALDHRADLFSLGSVLYAMGTGRPPFRASSTLAVLRRVSEETPRPIREINPDVPALLAEIIATLHAKDPAQRFASAADVAGLLGRYLAHLQQPARVPVPRLPPRRPTRPRRVRQGATLTLLAVACLLGLGVLSGLPTGNRLEEEATTEARPGGTPVRLRGALPELDGPVLTAAFAPGSEVLATAGGDRVVRLWDLTTTKARELRGHSARVWSVAFAPNGKTLASAGGEWDDPWQPQEVRLWDTSTGRERGRLHGHATLIFTVAFAPDGKTLASAGWDGTVRLWDAATGKTKATLKGHTAPVRFLAFSPDGRTLATGSFDRTARLWDVASGKQVRRLDANPYKVNCVAFSPDGQTLATAENLPTEGTEQRPELSGPGQVRLWNTATGEQRGVLRGASGMILTVAFASDGTTLVSAGGRWTSFGEITLWDIPAAAMPRSARRRYADMPGSQGGRERLTLLGHSEWVECVAFSPDGRMLVTAGGTPGSSSEVKLWDIHPSPPPAADSQARLKLSFR